LPHQKTSDNSDVKRNFLTA